nr:MAG TPA: hypothetical protein [Bacteriophage sp.]
MRDAYRGERVRGGARFRLLAHSQTETGVKRYFFIFPFLQPRRGLFCPMIADGRILSL